MDREAAEEVMRDRARSDAAIILKCSSRNHDTEGNRRRSTELLYRKPRRERLCSYARLEEVKLLGRKQYGAGAAMGGGGGEEGRVTSHGHRQGGGHNAIVCRGGLHSH